MYPLDNIQDKGPRQARASGREIRPTTDVGFDVHPAIQRLLNLSQVAAPVVQVAEADPPPAMDSSEAIVEAPTLTPSQPVVLPQGPQCQVPSPASPDDRTQGKARSGGLKRTAGALKERLAGELRLLLGYSRQYVSSGMTWPTTIIPALNVAPSQGSLP
jgi:hypothetical protein